MAEFELNNQTPKETLPQEISEIEEFPLQEDPIKNSYNQLFDNLQDQVEEISTNQMETRKSNVNGLNQEELNDPNRIQITITDKKSPIIILFGPPACGKTMTLIRLTRYLKGSGYAINPIRTFRPAYDNHYKKLCDSFNSMVNQSDAASSTNSISFMLVEVLKNGKRLCQILEAPGEYYFNPYDPSTPFPAYVNNIINSNNRKFWCIMVEPDWQDPSDRNAYVSRIHFVKRKMRSWDKTIFVFNKIDRTQFVIAPGKVNISQAKKEVSDLYPGIFAPFKNEHPITRFFVEWNCDFLPFQTGDFTESTKGLTYQEGPDEYPAKLWNTILKHIKG